MPNAARIPVAKAFIKEMVPHPSPTISIDCEAVKCIYNADYRCKAEKVAIKGNSANSSMETVCATFKEK